jgi:acetyltransferase-like isoleucine patch superfamily enzyme
MLEFARNVRPGVALSTGDNDNDNSRCAVRSFGTAIGRSSMKSVLYLVALFLPWILRRWILVRALGYTIHPTSRIGFAWVLPKRLVMEAHSEIRALTVCRGMELLQMRSYAAIGNLNWLTGCPTDSKHFAHQVDRRSELIIGDHGAITNRHLVDCTNRVTIGAFSVLAGFGSQILTHSVDLENSRQSSASITIGDYCFIGTDCVLLGGSSLPDHSVLGAKSLLNKEHVEPYCLYAGNPARAVKRLASDMKFFARQTGIVD